MSKKRASKTTTERARFERRRRETLSEIVLFRLTPGQRTRLKERAAELSRRRSETVTESDVLREALDCYFDEGGDP